VGGQHGLCGLVREAWSNVESSQDYPHVTLSVITSVLLLDLCTSFGSPVNNILYVYFFQILRYIPVFSNLHTYVNEEVYARMFSLVFQ